MNDWILAPSLEQLRKQVNGLFPERDRTSDGSIGDASHASRTSDHNPWVKETIGGKKVGVVTAIDIDADLSPNQNVGILVAAFVASRDPRIKYLIWNRQICRSYPAHGLKAWQWGPYDGTNAHQHHAHISVSADPKLYDDTRPWTLDLSAPPIQIPANRELRRGMFGDDVRILQAKLGILADGKFGDKTKAAVEQFQLAHGLRIDGRVGKNTRAELGL